MQWNAPLLVHRRFGPFGIRVFCRSYLWLNEEVWHESVEVHRRPESVCCEARRRRNAGGRDLRKAGIIRLHPVRPTASLRALFSSSKQRVRRVLKFARFPRLALVPSTGSLSPEHRADAPIPLRYSVRSPYGQSLPQFGIQPHVALSTRIQPIISIWQSSVELRAGALRPKASHTPSSNSNSEGCAVHDKRQSN